MGGSRANMKIVFFGTPDYVLPILKAVHKKFVTGPGKSPIVAVVTQSPKPVGRKQILFLK
jgi:methionyl-tRNA formyltransferase